MTDALDCDFTPTDVWWDGKEDICVQFPDGKYMIVDGGSSFYTELPDAAVPLVRQDEAVAALREAEAERDQSNAQIDKMIEEGVEAGLGLKSLKAGDGEAQLSVTTEGVAEATVLVMLDGLADMLGDATNYVEFDLRRRGKTTVSVCVRRYERPTPHELRLKAEAERDKALAELEELKDAMLRAMGSEGDPS